MSTIRWRRSEEGYCDSHCGRWKIVPKWWGRVKATEYVLEFHGDRLDSFNTQREAKAAAEKANPYER